MFERLNTPQEAYHYKLGAALKMERTVLEILQSSIDEAQDDEVVGALRDHLGQSGDHVRNLEEAFRALGAEIDDSPCPAIDGLQAEAKANAKKTDASIIDSILLQGAVEVEHHEIGVYENLILNARAMDRDDVAAILQRNLDNEEETLRRVLELQRRVAAVTPKDPVQGGGGIAGKLKSAISS
jgi:ferritin-like metal-binding protein YciE